MKTRTEIQNDLSQEFVRKGFFGIAYIAPRVGKIKFTLNCIKPKDKVIIIYPEKDVKQSWVDDLVKWKFKSKTIKYSTSQSFKKVKESCDVLVIDEIHRLSDSQITAVSGYIRTYGITKVIGLTGTLAEDTKINLSTRLGLNILVEYSIQQAVADKVITDYFIEVRCTALSTIKDIPIKWNDGVFMTSEKQSFDRLTYKLADSFNLSGKSVKMLRLLRMGIIKKSKAKIKLTKKILTESGNKRVLVFTGLTEVADNLAIDSYHSKNANETVKNNFLSGKSDKLAIVNKLTTGITFCKLNTAVINFFDSNAENMAQKINRVTCMEYDNPDKIAHIIIVTTNEEVEKKWLNKALSFFDPTKIKFHDCEVA